jgi:hypothetical protein
MLELAAAAKAVWSFIASPIGRILLAAGVIFALAAGVYHLGDDHGRAVVGLQVAKVRADRDRWKATAGGNLAAAKAWEKNFRYDARLREEERDDAVTAIKAAGRACDARVEAARKTTSAIQSIITRETTYDQAHCPVRRGVGFERLRDATGLAAGD